MTHSIANMSVKTLPFKTIKCQLISLTLAHKFIMCTNLQNMNGTFRYESSLQSNLFLVKTF